MAKFELHTAADGKPYWKQVADNGETLSTSETYESKEMAVKGAVAAGGKVGVTQGDGAILDCTAID